MPQPGQPADGALPSADDFDIDAAWNEADEAEGLPPAQELDDQPAAAEAPETAAESETTAESETDDFDGEDASPPSPSASAAPATAEPDIWANAHPDILAARDKLLADLEAREQHNKRIQSNLAAQQRQNEAARRELAALKAQKERQAAEADDPDLRSAEEEYPEVVKPMLKRMAALDERLSRTELEEQRRLDMAAQATQMRIEAETVKVETKIPDYLSLISVETQDDNGQAVRTAKPEFVAWYRSQPADVRAKVDRNADDITNAEEAIEVLGAFKAFADRLEAAHSPASPAQTPAQSRRDRQLRSSGAVSSRSQIGLTPGIPPDGDIDAMWAAADREDARKAAASRR